RVRKSGASVWDKFVACTASELLKKCLTWSSAIKTMTSPRRRSTDSRRGIFRGALSDRAVPAGRPGAHEAGSISGSNDFLPSFMHRSELALTRVLAIAGIMNARITVFHVGSINLNDHSVSFKHGYQSYQYGRALSLHRRLPAAI